MSFSLNPGQKWALDVIQNVMQQRQFKVNNFFLMGGRVSGKTVGAEFIAAMLLSRLSEEQVDFWAFRANAKDVKQTIRDVSVMFKAWGIAHKAVVSQQVIRLANGREMEFFGGNANASDKASYFTGLHRSNAKYLFIWLEEAYQFDNDVYQSLIGSARGKDETTQIIFIHTLNPWSEENWLVEYITQLMPFNYPYMSNPHGNGLIEGVVRNNFIQYTNWRVNRVNVSETQQRNFVEMHHYNPAKAMVSDWGFPGREGDAIYANYMKHVNRTPSYYSDQYTRYYGGVDWGWGESRTAGVTVALVGSINIKHGVEVWGQYIHDERKAHRAVDLVMDDIIQFYWRSIQSLSVKQGKPITDYRFTVMVDNSANTVIQMLNTQCRAKGLDKYLVFWACKKFPIDDRIDTTLYLMGKGLLTIAKNANLLYNEFETSYYEIKSNKNNGKKRVRANTNDHAINAFEYMIENQMYAFNPKR